MATAPKSGDLAEILAGPPALLLSTAGADVGGCGGGGWQGSSPPLLSINRFQQERSVRISYI